jgi:outer membrane receptor protein involved in Fe transport
MPRFFHRYRCIPALACATALAGGVPAAAEEPLPAGLLSESTGAPSVPADPQLSEIVVRARKVDEAVRIEYQALEEARDKELLPKLGATQYFVDQQDLEDLPQGKNTPLDKLLLQAPGVSYDSAISNPDFHVRNEYANVQYRINGIQLPDGVSALGPILETGFIGKLSLLDGVLPAQYGLRTAGVVDITTRSSFDQGGAVDLYAGSLGTVSPSVEVGGTEGRTQYFLTARYLQSDEGLENAMPTVEPIHDRTGQEKLFGYGSTLVGESSRLTFIGGAFLAHFQIPDVTGQAPLGDFGSATLSSASLNENESDKFFFGVLALQTHADGTDTQLSAFTRYASSEFVPDVYADLAFNDVASNVVRRSLQSGLQFDASVRLSDAHTLRAGMAVSLEQTQVSDLSTVLPLAPDGNPLPTPTVVDDASSRRGWNAGAYVQDEWQLSPMLTLNAGMRFDRMQQFVTAGQWSPRLALVYTPYAGTALHAGVSRYFTPPMQAQATPNNLALFANTTQQPAIALDDLVRPERATYVDIGVDQSVLPGLSAGADLYYKHSTDTLDDGQFGQAVMLDQFNYARGFSRGAEFKISYQNGGLRAYANLSVETTMARQVVSNQYLIGDPVELAYLADNYTYASDAQTTSASAGAAYGWHDFLASVDCFYGSGLRTGFANLGHTPGYTQCNGAIVRHFHPWSSQKALSVRLGVVNMFDRSYILRSGTGIGEFAPQYGPRRGMFAGLSLQF